MYCTHLAAESGQVLTAESSQLIALEGVCFGLTGIESGEAMGSLTMNEYAIFDQTITWQTASYITKDLDIIYDVGQGLLRWYRVQSKCVPCAYNNDCETTGLQVLGTQCLAGSTGAQFYIQNILAASVSEVCQILQDSKLNWNVCTIKVYSRPADPALSGPEDNCNTLMDVPFENIPECLNVYVQEKPVIKMKMGVYAIEAIFDYESSGGVSTGGEAVVTGSTSSSSSFEYSSYGLPELVVDSQSEYFSSWQSNPIVNTKMNVILSYLDTSLNYTDNNQAITPASSNIRTLCGTCTSMPSSFYVFHNLADTPDITNFLNNNTATLPDHLAMRYNNKSKTWTANYQMLGEDSDGPQKWNFVFNWNCLDTNGEDYVSPFWKFSIFVNKLNLNSGIDFDTKVHIVFPPDYLCEQINNLKINFPFTLNTVTNYVQNDFVQVTEDVVINDNIGIFKSNSWKSNPILDITLSVNSTISTLQKKDLTSIIP